MTKMFMTKSKCIRRYIQKKEKKQDSYIFQYTKKTRI
jgi:hypothetical protein